VPDLSALIEPSARRVRKVLNMSLFTTRRVLVVAAVATLVPAASALAGGSTKITLDEFSVKASPKSASAGKVTFNVKNAGQDEHYFLVIKTSTAASKLKVSHGRASTKGQVAELKDIAGGKSKKLSVSLKKGHYVLICNLPGHYQQGMRTDFTVK
jgi:uncharacterized cupredoxin-like copper-binding protein